MDNKNDNCLPDNYKLGRELIQSAIKMDEALIDLFKLETRKMKRIATSDSPIEHVRKVNILLRNIIFLLMMSDEKIKTGLTLCNIDTDEPT